MKSVFLDLNKRKGFSILFFLLIALSIFPAKSQVHTFQLADSVFLLNGRPFQMISGELHYPRIPREAWRHRMKMAKAMGLNTIGTYVFWNVHEPKKGLYDFSGNNDLAAFVNTAKEEGLWVVLRPSPYVCAEWEFGGYPYWLQKEEGLIVRSREEKFLAAYSKYLKEVARHIAPLQVHRGGNILMVQVENEYGFYSNDKAYMEENRRMFIEAGFDGLLYTCDPADKVGGGHIPGLLPAVNGVASPDKVKSIVQRYHGGKGPYYIAEWYPAWFDWWGTKHHTVPAEEYAPKLDSVLAAGISINMYMFHGGTTRGFMNGANYNDRDPYEPQISSYDYDAPLDEAGNPTKKFVVFRDIIQKHLPKGVSLPPVPEKKPTMARPPVQLNEVGMIVNNMPTPIRNKTPLTFEDLDQPYGFVLYRTTLPVNKKGYLRIKDLRDYALIYLNGKRVGILDRRLYQDSVMIDVPRGQYTLDIMVENLGRINFGPYLLKNKKGITEKVTFSGNDVQNWEMYSFPMDDVNTIQFDSRKADEKPVFIRGSFDLASTADTWLDMSQWGKGIVWINGHNLGRYWSIGPQQTLYVPVEWLKKGRNDVVVFELIKTQQRKLVFTETPILDRLAE